VDQGAIYKRKQFLRHCLGSRQESGPEAGSGYDYFPDFQNSSFPVKIYQENITEKGVLIKAVNSSLLLLDI
jgi:hypothetical protein